MKVEVVGLEHAALWMAILSGARCVWWGAVVTWWILYTEPLFFLHRVVTTFTFCRFSSTLNSIGSDVYVSKSQNLSPSRGSTAERALASSSPTSGITPTV